MIAVFAAIFGAIGFIVSICFVISELSVELHATRDRPLIIGMLSMIFFAGMLGCSMENIIS